MSYYAERKAHAVLVPYPLQGHINALLKLAKLLHLRGFHITFVHTEYNYKRFLKSKGPNALDGLADFRFETIPDGLPPLDDDADGDVSQDIPSLCDSISRKTFLQPFRDLLARLNHSAIEGLIPPVTCLVTDCFVSFPVQAAQELRLPILNFSPISSTAFLCFMNFHILFDRGIIPFKGESYLTNGYLDTKVDCIPGKKKKRTSKMSYIADRKPHAVLTPCPAQGHVNPMLKLAKLLHLRGFHITFVHTEYNHKRLLKSRGPNALDGLPDFRFETIPDGLPLMDDDADADVTQHVPSLCESIRKNFLQPFCNLVHRLNHSATEGLIPPVTCLVSDGIMPFTIQAAQQLGLPNIIFWPASACSFLSFMNYPTLVQKGFTPLKDESYLTNGYLDSRVDWIPGMKNFRLKDLPDFIRTTDINDVMLQFFIEVANRVERNSTILFNTFEGLESDVMKALSSMYPSLYTIGPLSFLLNQSPRDHLASLGSNLWKEDTECLDWLKSKEPRSVVYVNFGSVTVMSPEQLLEFAWGLANSKKPFLWIIRPDLVIGGSVILSSEFVNETRDRSLIASWCPQEQVLNHPSIGGFLTHCGWNSTTESVCAGVPMLCWPFFGDQPTNSRYICNEWEIGTEIDTKAKREEVEKLVNELMVGENGKKMRQKAIELKKKAEKETSPGGCSYMNLDKLIKEVMLRQH